MLLWLSKAFSIRKYPQKLKTAQLSKSASPNCAKIRRVGVAFSVPINEAL